MQERGAGVQQASKAVKDSVRELSRSSAQKTARHDYALAMPTSRRPVARTAIVTGILAALFLAALPSVPAKAATAWGSEPSANTNASLGNQLAGLSCVSATDCWSVGWADNASGFSQTLAEEWNGSQWQIFPSPSPGGSSENNGLYAVTCVTASDCWAVGWYENASGDDLTLIEYWNGSAWSQSASPTPGTLPSGSTFGITCTNTIVCLNGVTCPSASDCWAVGYYGDSAGDTQTLALQWNGTSWSQVATVNPSGSAANNGFNGGVSCLSASNCWAVGWHVQTQVITLAEQWNGTSWSQVSTVDPSASYDSLFGLACTSSSMCLAVGRYGPGPDLPLAEEWNGTAWSQVTAPAVGTGNNILYGITCASAADCWAAGYSTDTSGFTQTLLEQWNGTAFAPASSPDTSTSETNVLFSTYCWSDASCIAAGGGASTTGSVMQTLILAYTPDLVVSATLVGSTLSFVTAPANVIFPAVTLNGPDQTTTTVEALDIGDNTGSGAGWNVTLSNTPFTSGANILSNADFTVPSTPTAVCDAPVTCTLASWSSSVTYPYALPGATATKLLSANAGSGLANQTISVPWQGSFPADAYSGTYSSTWTITLAAGP